MHPNVVAYLGGVLCAYFIAFCIWGVISASVLKGAVGLYNMMAGGEHSERGVPSPSLGRAFVIVFVTMMLNVALGVGLLLAANAGAGPAIANSPRRQLVSVFVAQAISYPVGMIVLAGMISSILPTSLGRAFLVTLCHVLIVALILVAVGGLVVVCLGVGGVR